MVASMCGIPALDRLAPEFLTYFHNLSASMPSQTILSQILLHFNVIVTKDKSCLYDLLGPFGDLVTGP